MAGFLLSRALIFALLVHASHHHQVKQGSSPLPGGPGAPVINAGGGLGLQGVLALSQGVPDASQSGPSAVVVPPVPGYYGVAGGGVGAGVAGAPSVGAAAVYEPTWEVAPRPFEGPASDNSEGAGGAGGGGVGSSDADASSLGFFPFPVPEFTPGELSHVERTFEHGSNDHESERLGERPRRPFPFGFDGSVGGGGVSVFAGGAGGAAGTSFPVGPGLPNFPGHYFYPYYDWYFLTGQYPPGTVSHFSSSFEQGKDSYRDSHFNKYYYPVPDGPVVPKYPHPYKGVQQVQVGSQA